MIIKTSNGFITGGSNGTIYIYLKPENKKKLNHYVFIQEKLIRYREHPTTITSLAFDEDYIFCGMENNSLMKVAFTLTKKQDSKFEHVLESFHTDKITGMDLCVRK